MKQRKKNIRLLSILMALVVVSAVLYSIPKNRKTTIENAGLFQLSDTSAIGRVTMNSAELDNELIRTDSGWVINNKLKADESIMTVLLSVMEKVEILRPVPESQKAEMEKAFENGAVEVQFFEGDQQVESFIAGSNATKTISVFKSPGGDYYVVNLPGYDSFVTGIFQIPELDWKDRLIVNATPTGLKQLEVQYMDDQEKSFTVDVKGNIPVISDINKLDTMALMDYLDQFQYFQADQYLNAGNNRYDSLLEAGPFVKFRFDNVNNKGDITIAFYHKLRGDNMILGLTNKGEKALFNYKRIAGIFKNKQHFRKD